MWQIMGWKPNEMWGLVFEDVINIVSRLVIMYNYWYGEKLVGWNKFMEFNHIECVSKYFIRFRTFRSLKKIIIWANFHTKLEPEWKKTLHSDLFVSAHAWNVYMDVHLGQFIKCTGWNVRRGELAKALWVFWLSHRNRTLHSNNAPKRAPGYAGLIEGHYRV